MATIAELEVTVDASQGTAELTKFATTAEQTGGKVSELEAHMQRMQDAWSGYFATIKAAGYTEIDTVERAIGAYQAYGREVDASNAKAVAAFRASGDQLRDYLFGLQATDEQLKRILTTVQQVESRAGGAGFAALASEMKQIAVPTQMYAVGATDLQMVEKAALGAGTGLGLMRRQVTTLLASMGGMPPAIERITSSMGAMAYGNQVMLVMLGVLVAAVGAWKYFGSEVDAAGKKAEEASARIVKLGQDAGRTDITKLADDLRLTRLELEKLDESKWVAFKLGLAEALKMATGIDALSVEMRKTLQEHQDMVAGIAAGERELDELLGKRAADATATEGGGLADLVRAKRATPQDVARLHQLIADETELLGVYSREKQQTPDVVAQRAKLVQQIKDWTDALDPHIKKVHEHAAAFEHLDNAIEKARLSIDRNLADAEGLYAATQKGTDAVNAYNDLIAIRNGLEAAGYGLDSTGLAILAAKIELTQVLARKTQDYNAVQKEIQHLDAHTDLSPAKSELTQMLTDLQRGWGNFFTKLVSEGGKAFHDLASVARGFIGRLVGELASLQATGLFHNLAVGLQGSNELLSSDSWLAGFAYNHRQAIGGAGIGLAGLGVGYGIGSMTTDAPLGALGGAAAGAATGAMIGSMVPVIGTAVGAVIGGVTGLVGGLLGSASKLREARKQYEDTEAKFLQETKANQSSYSQQLAKLNADFKALGDAAAAAHQAVSSQAVDAYQAAQARIRTDFLDNLTKQLNDLGGATGSYANALADIQQAYEQNLQTIKDLGLGTDATAKATALYQQALAQLQAQQAEATRQIGEDINSRLLTAMGLTDLAARAQLQSEQRRRLLQLEAQGATAAQIATEQYVDQLEREALLRQQATSALKTAADTQATALAALERSAQDSVTALQRVSDGLSHFRDGLTVGSYSPLAPADQLAELQSRVQALFAAAKGGDRNAAEQFPGVAQQYLDAARSMYASSPAYVQAFDRVRDMTDQLNGLFATQLSDAQQQLAVLNQQTDLLQQIIAALGNGTTITADALNTLRADLAESATQSGANGVATVATLQAVLTALQTQTNVDTGHADALTAMIDALRANEAAQNSGFDAQEAAIRQSAADQIAAAQAQWSQDDANWQTQIDQATAAYGIQSDQVQLLEAARQNAHDAYVAQVAAINAQRDAQLAAIEQQRQDYDTGVAAQIALLQQIRDAITATSGTGTPSIGTDGLTGPRYSDANSQTTGTGLTTASASDASATSTGTAALQAAVTKTNDRLQALADKVDALIALESSAWQQQLDKMDDVNANTGSSATSLRRVASGSGSLGYTT